MRTLALFILITVLSNLCGGQPVRFRITPECAAAATDIFHLDFNAAEAHLNNEQKRNPRNLAPVYYKNQICFIKAFVSEESEDFEALKKSTQNTLELLEQLPDSEPWRDLASAEAMLRLAIVKIKWEEYWSAGFQIRKGFKLVMKNRNDFPDFIPGVRMAGFLHAAIGSVPENYRWLSNLAGMKGTIAQGRTELNRALDASVKDIKLHYLMDETLWLTAFTESHFAKNTARALSLLDQYSTQQDCNGLMGFIRLNTMLAAEKFDDALQLLNQYKSDQGLYPIRYLKYLKGQLLLCDLKTGAASKELAAYLNGNKGSSFVKSAWHKLGWSKLIEGDTAGYRMCMRNVLTAGKTFTDEDKAAKREAESAIIPNVALLRCRLQFDGGHYQSALKTLTLIAPDELTSLKDLVEFTYRMARICEKRGVRDQALKYYISTYQSSKDYEWYFAANSALLLGGIYESEGNKKLALQWYSNCLLLRNHEYQNSIDQKAEAGKNRVSDLK